MRKKLLMGGSRAGWLGEIIRASCDGNFQSGKSREVFATTTTLYIQCSCTTLINDVNYSGGTPAPAKAVSLQKRPSHLAPNYHAPKNLLSNPNSKRKHSQCTLYNHRDGGLSCPQDRNAKIH